MINQDELNLLVALLKTVDKHDLNTFNSLRRKLEGTDALDFEFVSEALSKRGSLKSQPKPGYDAKIKETVRKMDARKGELVSHLITLIKSKSAMKKLSEFTVFLNSNNIPTKKVGSWPEGIYKIVIECLQNDIDYVEKLNDALTSSSKDNRSLESWSEIILKS